MRFFFSFVRQSFEETKQFQVKILELLTLSQIQSLKFISQSYLIPHHPDNP